MPTAELTPKQNRERLAAETPGNEERPRRRWPLAAAVIALALAAAAGFLFFRNGDETGSPGIELTLTAAPTTVEIGDRTVETWAFNGQVPGPEIRLDAGEVVRATVRNDLPQPLTVHWHGIAIANEMDGVPDVTQKAIAPGEEFVYEFSAPDPGTYFYHPHTGTQLDRGLYAPLIVEDPAETGAYDREITLMLDDWIDGTGETPDQVLSRLEGGGSTMEGMGSGASGPMAGMPGSATEDQGASAMPGMGMPERAEEATEAGSDAAASEGPLGDDTGDVDYPLFLVNGRPPTDPPVFDVKPGERVRLRLINAGSDTPFRVALAGKRLTAVATDGFAVRPAPAESILLGMGERYDAEITVDREGVLPLVAEAEGKGARALAVLRAGPGTVPGPGVRIPELRARPLALDDLRPAPEVALPPGPPDRTYRLALTGNMATYSWAIDVIGARELTVREGERVRLVLVNRTPMWHPMHLHGQTFQVVAPGGRPGPRKDTVIVPARGRETVEFIADNPGRWALHCHNIYHAEAGMVTVLSYGARGEEAPAVADAPQSGEAETMDGSKAPVREMDAMDMDG